MTLGESRECNKCGETKKFVVHAFDRWVLCGDCWVEYMKRVETFPEVPSFLTRAQVMEFCSFMNGEEVEVVEDSGSEEGETDTFGRFVMYEERYEKMVKTKKAERVERYTEDTEEYEKASEEARLAFAEWELAKKKERMFWMAWEKADARLAAARPKYGEGNPY